MLSPSPGLTGSGSAGMEPGRTATLWSAPRILRRKANRPKQSENVICETPTGNTPTCGQANEWSLSVRPSSPAGSEKSLCLPLGSSTLSDSGAMGAVKQFSSNKLANVIISRYAHLCANSEIKFNCDVRSIDFSFLSDSDLTILLDNILNGAYKSAEKSEERFIDMSIGSFNEAYVVLNVRHSVDGSPDIKNSERAARISKIIQKYGGQASFDCADERIFTAKIMFKSSVVKK